MQSIAEADWKVYRELFPVWQSRFYRRTLDELAKLASEPADDAAERYQQLRDFMNDRDRASSSAFGNFSRSSAGLQLMVIASQGLLREEEREQFSAALLERLDAMVGTRSNR